MPTEFDYALAEEFFATGHEPSVITFPNGARAVNAREWLWNPASVNEDDGPWLITWQ